MYMSGAKSAQRPEVRAFVEYYLEHGPALAEEVGYVRLPADIGARASERFVSGQTGTAFLNDAGEKPSGTLASLYK